MVQNKGQKMLSINGTHNHIHFFMGMKPSCCLSDFVRELKKSSSNFIREKRFTPFRFQWQEGFGAFLIGIQQSDKLIQYIGTKRTHKENLPGRIFGVFTRV
ncbi:MAG: transposase [Bacteroidales bacterium]|nr:transposase [Bacteroidales bacterium]